MGHDLDHPAAPTRRRLATALEFSVADLELILGPDAPTTVSNFRLPIWHEHDIDLIRSMAHIGSIDRVMIHPLLQTPEYIAAVQLCQPNTPSDEQIEERIEEGLRRQALLERDPDPLALTALIPEVVLWDQVGGPTVMAPQLDHLLQMMEWPTIDIRILAADGRLVKVRSGFEMFTELGDSGPYLAATIDILAVRYRSGPEIIEPFVDLWDHLDSIALDPATSRRKIIQIRDEYLSGERS